MPSAHRHLHLNVQRTMSRGKVTADMERAFGLGADTIGMCELETTWHHHEFLRCARKYGYDTYLPEKGAAGALGLAVNRDYGRIILKRAVFAAPHKRGVSPDRYVNRVRVQRRADKQTVAVVEHHAYSSGWTGSRFLDALRQARWYIGMGVLQRVCRRATGFNDVVIGGGDLNRPPSTFKGAVLPGLLSRRGMKSTGYVRTDGTHGKTKFDYSWFLSQKQKVVCTFDFTPGFQSDHDGIFATFRW